MEPHLAELHQENAGDLRMKPTALWMAAAKSWHQQSHQRQSPFEQKDRKNIASVSSLSYAWTLGLRPSVDMNERRKLLSDLRGAPALVKLYFIL